MTADDSLLFAGTQRLNNSNNLPAGTLVNGMTFQAGAGPFVLSGNTVDLYGNIINNSTNTQSIDLALTLVGGTETLNTAAGGLTIGGNIGQSGGSYGITKTGPGTLILSGNNTYSGGTTIDAGTLIVISRGALADGTSLTVGAGGAGGDESISSSSEIVATPAAATAPAPALSVPAVTARVDIISGYFCGGWHVPELAKGVADLETTPSGTVHSMVDSGTCHPYGTISQVILTQSPSAAAPPASPELFAVPPSGGFWAGFRLKPALQTAAGASGTSPATAGTAVLNATVWNQALSTAMAAGLSALRLDWLWESLDLPNGLGQTQQTDFDRSAWDAALAWYGQ